MQIKSESILFASAVIIAFISSFVLQADAILCHQCNSRLDAGCDNLILNTPRNQRDKQFLKECEGVQPSKMFCRKTVIEFDVGKEVRIERSCGWIPESHQNTCFTADNEGYKQVVCSCTGDGCNGANGMRSPTGLYTLLGGILLVACTKLSLF